MMPKKREIILDTETTGIYVGHGHRLVEIGAIELIDGVPTGHHFHAYINPCRDVPDEVVAIHGLSGAFLADKPVFADIAQELIEFIDNAPIIILCGTTKSGYTLDIAFLEMEMIRSGIKPYHESQWTNVLPWAQTLLGWGKASLNKVLDHYKIDRTGRGDKGGHGALLDAQLLAAAYPLLRRDYEAHNAAKQNRPKPPDPGPS